MTKVIKKNLKYLQYLARDAKPDTKEEASRVLQYYENRKIKNITTAEHFLLKFSSRNKTVRGSAVMRFRAKEDDIKDLGLVSKKAIKKVKSN